MQVALLSDKDCFLGCSCSSEACGRGSAPSEPAVRPPHPGSEPFVSLTSRIFQQFLLFDHHAPVQETLRRGHTPGTWIPAEPSLSEVPTVKEHSALIGWSTLTARSYWSRPVPFQPVIQLPGPLADAIPRQFSSCLCVFGCKMLNKRGENKSLTCGTERDSAQTVAVSPAVPQAAGGGVLQPHKHWGVGRFWGIHVENKVVWEREEGQHGEWSVSAADHTRLSLLMPVNLGNGVFYQLTSLIHVYFR